MKNNFTVQELDQKYPDMFSSIDRQFAHFLQNISGSISQELEIAARILSSRTNSGDICVSISSIAGKEIGNVIMNSSVTDGFLLHGAKEWLMVLKESPVVGAPGELKPLILDGDRLYLYRYWQYENNLADNIKARLSYKPDIDTAALKKNIEKMFDPEKDRDQLIAAAGALLNGFCIISGGPGTGKTSLIIKILSLILGSEKKTKDLRIAIAAPTGKAAARLNESIKNAGSIVNIIPESFTIHRLLGNIHGSPYFKYNRDRKLPYDIIIVDESSMADLALLSKLFEAVPYASRIILLGDKDQLASVEAGSVFGDICNTGNDHSPSGKFMDFLADISALKIPASNTKKSPAIADSIMLLRRSYRFGSESGIGALSRAIRDNNADEAVAVLKNKSFPDVCLTENADGGSLMSLISDRVVSGFRNYLEADTIEKALESFTDFTILCALRKGPFGVEELNKLAEDILHKKGLIFKNTGWYRGRPVMISSNDYGLKLYNGDSGIIMQDESGRLDFCMQAADGSVRKILPVKLPAHETVFSMTVHKSQGSEYNNVLLVLPENDSQVLSRELLYTAVTRARKKVEIFGSERILRKMINNPTKRISGLRDALWSEGIV